MPIVSVWTRNRRAGPDFDYEPPGPPDQEWPPLTIYNHILWTAPMVPGPPWNINEDHHIAYDADEGCWLGTTAGEVDRVKVFFYLDLFTGAYYAHLEAWRGINLWTTVTSPVSGVPPNKVFDINITEWWGIMPENVIEAEFRS